MFTVTRTQLTQLLKTLSSCPKISPSLSAARRPSLRAFSGQRRSNEGPLSGHQQKLALLGYSEFETNTGQRSSSRSSSRSNSRSSSRSSRSRAVTMEESMPLAQSLADKVKALIKDHDVVVFSKTTCPFCTRVKVLFDSIGIDAKVYEVDQQDDGPQVQQYLQQLTKQSTVPNVFIKGQHIGGCDSTLEAFGNGSLRALLEGKPPQDYAAKVERLIRGNTAVVFSKTTCPYCVKVKELLYSLGVMPTVFEVDQEPDGAEVHQAVIAKTQHRSVPAVFIRGEFLGGCDDTVKAQESGLLMTLLEGEMSNEVDTQSFDYDLMVIGGGSGGLAAAKEAGSLGKKVALCDFVVPTPLGTAWGLGGTCVNVGCIPKKLMHQASLHGEHRADSQAFGWPAPAAALESSQHNWEQMVENIQNYIKSLNWGYRKELNKRKVKYFNALGEVTSPHSVKLTGKNGDVQTVTAKNIIVAVGGRPSYPDIPGAKDFGITSDDIFSLSSPPGKTLIVGASYIALECGGFLRGLGYDVTIMVRSILLRGFDRQMADMIGAHMEKMGVQFVRETVPTAVAKDELGKLKVTAANKDGEVTLSGFDTVVFAIGREACTEKLGLGEVQVKLNPKNNKIIVDEWERSSVRSIFAVGDVIDGKPELTPVAIHAGKLLAQRLAGSHKRLTHYKQIPTTVFTPLEYGSVGLSEEDAVAIFSQSNIVVYHNSFKPLEHSLTRDDAVGYAKLICVRSLDELVVGLHVLSPNAGEITQGFAIGLKLGARKKDFDDLIGIHPTCAEVFTTFSTVKNPGDKPPATTGC